MGVGLWLMLLAVEYYILYEKWEIRCILEIENQKSNNYETINLLEIFMISTRIKVALGDLFRLAGRVGLP